MRDKLDILYIIALVVLVSGLIFQSIEIDKLSKQCNEYVTIIEKLDTKPIVITTIKK